MPWLRKLARWFDSRLGLAELVMPVLRHPIPASAAGPLGWWYVFGSASLTLLAIQFLTGVLLALVYVPDAGQAYESLQYLTHQQPWGGFFRAVHFWAASGMVLMVVVHMTQVFLHGAFKYPRELTWVVGVLLLVLTLLLSFTGYLLPWDQLAIWAITVGSNMARATPVLGHEGPGFQLLNLGGYDLITNASDARFLLLGSRFVGEETLNRFYILHCVAIPLVVATLIAIHFWRVRKDGGISQPL